MLVDSIQQSGMHLNIQALVPTTSNNQHSAVVTFMYENIEEWVLTTLITGDKLIHEVSMFSKSCQGQA